MNEIICENIGFQYSNQTPFQLQVSCKIPLGKWVVLTGECGSGKTTFGKILAGLLEVQNGNLQFPEIINSAGDRVYLFQNPDDQLVTFSILREMAFALENRNYPQHKMNELTADELQNIGLWERRYDSPNSLSGGQKQRLALSSLLIGNPKLVILDEPTSFLDVLGKQKFCKAIRQLVDKGLSVIWITHDSDEIGLSDFQIHMENGQIVYSGEPREM